MELDFEIDKITESIENAPFNIGKGKKYIGVCGNLTAFGCKLSKDLGFNGVVGFDPKTAFHVRFNCAGANKVGEFNRTKWRLS